MSDIFVLFYKYGDAKPYRRATDNNIYALIHLANREKPDQAYIVCYYNPIGRIVWDTQSDFGKDE